MSTQGPFPGSRPLSELITAADIEASRDNPDATWCFAGLSPLVVWRRCECPWWHRLPFVGLFVHAKWP